MKYFAKKLWLSTLRALILLKQAVVRLGQWIGRGFGVLERQYRRTLGPVLYGAGLRAKRKLGLSQVSQPTSFVEFFGRRSTLQAILFLVIVTIMIPHSKLYTKDSARIAGRDTLLFELVGPGDEFPEVEEVIAVTARDVDTSQGWREGSVSVVTPGSIDNVERVQPVQEIAGITGGRAITKPTILPGAELPTVDGATQSRGRREIVEHLVQEGESIGVIAEEYGLSLTTLLWANDLTSRSLIRPGDTLMILPTDGVAHTVKKNETLGKIASTYSSSVDEIVKFNKLKNDGADITVGQDLIIPGGEKPKPIVRRAVVRAPKAQPSTFRNVSAPPPSVTAPAGTNWLWPTDVRTITQYYGWRHTGVDIAGPIGTALRASKNGTVTKSQCGWNGGYGCMIIVDHGGGINTLYAHASKLYVTVGQRVTQGQAIASMGSTGRSTGPHIHFEVRVNGRRVNPFQYIR